MTGKRVGKKKREYRGGIDGKTVERREARLGKLEERRL